MEVAIGIDTHKGSLAAASVDGLGRVLGVLEFTNDPTGHRSLVRWVREQAEPRRIGIEGSLCYGAAVARTLLEGAEDVREVAPSLTHLERRRRAKGKSDSVDAVAIARVVAADETLPSARRAAVLSDLKLHPGDFMVLPIGIPHRFGNLTDRPVRVVGVVAPTGIESFFEEEAAYYSTLSGPPDPQRIAEMAAPYGLTLLGPPLSRD